MKYLESFDVFGGGEYERMSRSRFTEAMNKMDRIGGVDISEEQKVVVTMVAWVQRAVS